MLTDTKDKKTDIRKICLLTNSLGIGGKERIMAELATYFAGRPNVDLHIVLYGRNRELFYSVPDNVIIHTPKLRFNNRLRLMSTVGTLLYMRHEVKVIKPMTILSLGEFWNSLVLLALFGLKYPVYISDRSQPAKHLGKLHNFLRYFLYKRAAGYIAQTRIAERIARKNKWNKNTIVIGNPVRELKSQDDLIREKTVLSVGRLLNTKHFDKLIELFLEIDDPEWKLVIVGGDTLRQNNSVLLRKLIKKHNAEDRVFLEGTQSQIDNYYLTSQIFAFMSSSEGFPNVIAEALSAGLPVVAYDCIAGPSELIQDGENGFLVPLFDSKTFKDKLTLLMQDQKLRQKMESNTRDSIEKFRQQNIGKSVHDFICRS